MELNCLLVDDDSMALLSIERLCQKNENLRIVGTCTNAQEAIDFFAGDVRVDLLFLDVEMPEISGIELLERLPVTPMVIFTTSNSNYAFDAFEYGAVDFLKKPITQPRFEQAIQKITSSLEASVSYRAAANEVYIREDGKLVKISCDDILFFENVGDYIRIKTESGKSHIIHGTLKSVDEKLNDPRFLKIHRTFIINLQKIKDIEENTVVVEKTVIPISRAHKPILMSCLKIL